MTGSTEVRIEYEWLPAPTVKAPELRATWARLEVHVGNACVTLVEDQESKSSRRGIYCSLYPLAEWIAYNWWFLRADSRPASASARPDMHPGRLRLGYRQYQRHNFRGAGDGFLWPNLLVLPQGGSTQFIWQADPIADRAAIQFLSSGQAFLDTQRVAARLADFVESVLTRLHETGLKETALSKEWQAVQAADDDEAAFCTAAARLGLDPYAEATKYADDILRAAADLPPDLFDDFVDAVSPQNIDAGLKWVKDARQDIEGLSTPSPAAPLTSLLRPAGEEKVWSTLRPWEVGWEQARQVRAAVGIQPSETFDIENSLSVTTRWSGDRGFQAFGSRDFDTGPSVVLARSSRDSAKRFILARAAWHVIWGGSQNFLVTSAYTDKQKFERAFAAELLAPAAGVAERLEPYPSIDGFADIDEAAHHFRVSPMIIEHQIQNQLMNTW